MAPAQGEIAVGSGVTANFRLGVITASSSHLAEPRMERRIDISLDISDDSDDLVHWRRALRRDAEGRMSRQRKASGRRAHGQEPTSIDEGACRGHGIYSAQGQ